MEQFKKITIADRDILTKYLNMRKHRACDYSVGNLILWSEVYNIQYTIAEDMLFIKFMKYEEHNFAFPMGQGDLKKAFEWLFQYCKEQDIKLIMNMIEPDMFDDIEKLYPGEYDISYVRDNADYVYRIEDLKNLSGKKYHGKKNHINKFIKTNTDWVYESITVENSGECIEMVKEWCRENKCCKDKEKAEEICVLIMGIKYKKELNLLGGIIRTSGRIVALTLGEKSGEDMFIIHFEKAFSDVQGAYQMINQQFIIHELSNYTYVNREEDMGVMGLRKAKESYRPVFMVEKGVLVRR
ncbi:MAG TPA: phosphatidylglycerol lysyltransferase domain-containing protein [Lachnospiraceae bacterium]|nr:phosphatidylglycerol lysyltransferase domain-containing protein [Lachnospiraceae bacterium]